MEVIAGSVGKGKEKRFPDAPRLDRLHETLSNIAEKVIEKWKAISAIASIVWQKCMKHVQTWSVPCNLLLSLSPV